MLTQMLSNVSYEKTSPFQHVNFIVTQEHVLNLFIIRFSRASSEGPCVGAVTIETTMYLNKHINFYCSVKIIGLARPR